MPFQPNQDDVKAINTIRTLALDTVNKANSGHPGAPMGMAPAAHVLFSRFFQCNPQDPKWVNRDRFVLSNGHACALQYTLLHLLGYKVSIDDLKQFRQLDSITPGHPELGVTEGVEVTTGPLGQGFANAVGLAIAQAHLGATFNKDNFSLFDNYTYMFTGDGCLMEGVASEAASLAGHLQLGNLIAVYDDNQISIDGSTSIAFTEDVGKRFEAYDWQVLTVEDGNDDLEGIYKAIEAARAEKNKPTLIRLKTVIGFGSRDQGTHGVHGNPLKADDTVEIKKKFGFNPEEFFVVPDETKKIYADVAKRGAEAEKKWQQAFDEYKAKYADEAADIERRIAGKLPQGWEKALPEFKPTDDAVASRKLSEVLLAKLSTVIPELVSGSADLTPSNLTRWKNAVDFQPKANGLGDYTGRYIRYGVREHGMGAIANGIAAYGANLMIPAIGTFLNFVSYAAGAVRLSALSHQRVIWVATHDSIGLGEDGPTHQPVETVAHFRALPNCNVWRPADGNETSAAYYMALTSTHTPSILALTRQNLPQLEGSSIEKANKGGYTLVEVDGKPDVTFVATGSEVAIAVEAAELLSKQGVKARVASLPCWEVFRAQDSQYKLSVLPDGAPIVSVEAYTTMGWAEFSHAHCGIDTFGASAPAKQVYAKFGLTGEAVAKRAEKAISYFRDLGHPVYSPLSHQLAL
ncbi:Transketolase, thiamine diphosphate binding domain-containing protein [Rhodotorula diobovata]|uniref:Transketolase n=1 Tax=Rhodotorula diobovata TaxID=5288 RepID=A0A5C5FYN6_9BASI|nr:Transketolase, thiamine diphosphate binding domain-containing protein [Rhodotorula diobovata]